MTLHQFPRRFLTRSRLRPQNKSTYVRNAVSYAYYYSAPSCDHFSRHGEWKKYLATNRLKKKLIWKSIINRTNLTNIASGSNTRPVPVFLFSPLVVLKLDMNAYTYCSKVKCWKLAVWRIRHSCNTSWSVLPFMFFLSRVICHEVSSPSRFFVFGDWIFLWRPFCHLKSPKGDFLKKWAWSAAIKTLFWQIN